MSVDHESNWVAHKTWKNARFARYTGFSFHARSASVLNVNLAFVLQTTERHTFTLTSQQCPSLWPHLPQQNLNLWIFVESASMHHVCGASERYCWNNLASMTTTVNRILRYRLIPPPPTRRCRSTIGSKAGQDERQGFQPCGNFTRHEFIKYECIS